MSNAEACNAEDRAGNAATAGNVTCDMDTGDAAVTGGSSIARRDAGLAAGNGDTAGDVLATIHVGSTTRERAGSIANAAHGVADSASGNADFVAGVSLRFAETRSSSAGAWSVRRACMGTVALIAPPFPCMDGMPDGSGSELSSVRSETVAASVGDAGGAANAAALDTADVAERRTAGIIAGVTA